MPFERSPASRAGIRGAACSTSPAPRPGRRSSASSSSGCSSIRGSPSPRASSCQGVAVGGDRCTGIVTERREITARATLLATGGLASLWARTTNPPGATGDGMAMAFRAGAAARRPRVRPVPPDRARGNGLLLSEALRGEGAVLIDAEGHRFTDELAPRDVVARAVAERGTALLDLRLIDRGRFPALMEALEQRGLRPRVRADPRVARGALHDGRRRHGPRRPHGRSRASTPPASAPALASTERTGSLRTRCSSASSSAAAPLSPPSPTRPRTASSQGQSL